MMFRSLLRRSLPVMPGLVSAGLTLPAPGASLSYTNDFSGSGSNTALPNEVTDSQWEVNSGSYLNTVTSGAIVVSSSSMDINDAAAVEILTLRTQFTLDAATQTSTGTSTLGFGLFASTNSFNGTSPQSYYLADFAFADSTADSNEGRLRILSLGAANADFTGGTTAANLGLADANPGTANVAVNPGTTYTLLLTATRAGTALNFSLGLYDAAGTSQIGTSAIAADPTALTGGFFGYRNRYEPNPSGTISARFDNRSVVAEPGVSALRLGGLAGLRRRRR